MATIATRVRYEKAAGLTEMRLVQAPVVVCGECMFHIPHATRPGGWCACQASASRWKPVSAGRATCGSDFAPWPEGSPAQAFLAAMRVPRHSPDFNIRLQGRARATCCVTLRPPLGRSPFSHRG